MAWCHNTMHCLGVKSFIAWWWFWTNHKYSTTKLCWELCGLLKLTTICIRFFRNIFEGIKGIVQICIWRWPHRNFNGNYIHFPYTANIAHIYSFQGITSWIISVKVMDTKHKYDPFLMYSEYRIALRHKRWLGRHIDVIFATQCQLIDKCSIGCHLFLPHHPGKTCTMPNWSASLYTRPKTSTPCMTDL